LTSAASIVGGMLAGGVLGLLVLPRWLPGLDASLAGAAPHAPWFICRATGTVAFTLLWLTTLTGLAISARLARDLSVGAAVLDLHQHMALLGIAYASVHALCLGFDRYIGFDALELALPFSTRRYRPLWMGLGQVALYGQIPVLIAFFARRDLGPVTWRALHATSVGLFPLLLLHALFCGSSATSAWQLGLYVIAGSSVLFVGTYRALLAGSSPRVPRQS
jgi:predicted ferric reductase